jgi:hypothetical protein
MLSKNELFNIIEQAIDSYTTKHPSDEIDISDLADSIVERMDEEGVFEDNGGEVMYD